MAFPGVVGHERAKEVLHRALGSGTVHSGYLLCGPEGVGKRLLASAFARVFLCVAGGADPCGVCPTCTLPAAAPHPDLLEVGPEERRKTISIEQVRELCAWIGLSPAWGRRKAAIVDPADAMTPEAANALLKTLEEPPPGRVILLVASRPASLPATVLSRCQQVFHGGLAEEEVAEVLRRAGWPPQTARAAAGVAEGSPGGALARDGKAWQEASAAVAAFLEAFAGGDRGAALALAEGLREGRDQAGTTLQVLVSRLRQALRQRLGARPGGASELPPALQGLGTEELCRLLDASLAAWRRLEGNANARLALSSLVRAGGAGLDG
jgi:DNA polymerase-3 subunit delta'